MKEIVFSWLFVVAVGILLVYSGYAFVAWELNPAQWSKTDRGSVAVICFLLIIIASGLALVKASSSEE